MSGCGSVSSGNVMGFWGQTSARWPTAGTSRRVSWFLNGKDDVRSSYYLEDVATEFHVQGLELDWACVV